MEIFNLPPTVILHQVTQIFTDWIDRCLESVASKALFDATVAMLHPTTIMTTALSKLANQNRGSTCDFEKSKLNRASFFCVRLILNCESSKGLSWMIICIELGLHASYELSLDQSATRIKGSCSKS